MTTIFDYVTQQETKYSQPVELAESWMWNMKEHVTRSFLYLNSQFEDNNENRDLRPFKNIVLPILNIQHRLEGFDVKDIELFVDNPDEYFKSMLINKYHYKWALENGLDSFIDEMVEAYCDYGGVLVRKTKSAKPEVIDLRSLAFCSQHDLLNNPFGILHNMSFSQLRAEAKARGWGEEGADIDIESLIALVKAEDENANTLDIYEIHGSMPIEWLNDEEVGQESEKDVNQIQVIAYYKDSDNTNQGACLFKKEMPTLPFKFLDRDPVFNRALGRGGVEELFEDQIWTNWDTVKSTEMLDSASKTLFQSDDPTFKSKNNLNNAKNNQVFSLQEGRKIGQIDTFPRNISVFNDNVERFWQHAQIMGSAPESLQGEAPSSGTPFKLYEAQQMEGKGMHEYRKGKLAVFMDEIYRDWILPHLAKEVVKEQTFMAELSAEEMKTVVDKVMVLKTNDFVKRMILSMQEVKEDMVDLYKQQVEQDIAKEGNKRFFKILKDEMKNIELSVFTNIAGKQKDLALLTDKLVNVFREMAQNPQIRQDPEAMKIFNTILESSGLSPIVFSPPVQQPQQQQLPQQQAPAEAGLQMTQQQ